MNRFRLALIALLVVVLAPAVEAGETLVRFDDLQKRLGSPGLRLLDARPRPDYDRGHAPGAVWVDSKAAQAIASQPGGLTNRAAWQAWVEPLGIGPKTEVLIFDGAKQLDAARLWWLLSYLGLTHVGLIDGNYPLWVAEQRPSTTDIPQVSPGQFNVAFQADRLATRDDVLTTLQTGRAAIVDARSIEEYTGEKKLSKRGGHIPKACRVEWSNLVAENGRFIDDSALKAKLAEAGVKPGEPVITHCQGGGRASVDAFAIGRLGHPTRNFYQGWSDWGNTPETPVVEGREASKRP